MKWFKHDSDASIDAKLQELLLDYGATGYGLYWYCVELIAQGVSENNITFELEHDARIIARNLNLTVQETKDMIKKMVELNLFSISANQKLACYALAKRIDKSMTSNPHFREVISQIRDNHDFTPNNHDSIMTKSEKVMQEKNRKEEIREEEKRLDIYSSLSSEVITYLNERAGTRYNPKVRKNIELITARAKEGFALDDFKEVIDKKVMLWGNDPRMQAYIRPSTLFGTKFEAYLNEIVTTARALAVTGAISQKTAQGLGVMQEFMGSEQ